MGVKRNASYQSGENMAKKTDEELYDVAINMIGSVAKLPVIRVDREAFLRQQFAGSEYLDEILEHGPQHVYTAESLRRKADGLISRRIRPLLPPSWQEFPADLPPLPLEVPMWPNTLVSRLTWHRKSPISSERMICSPTSRN